MIRSVRTGALRISNRVQWPGSRKEQVTIPASLRDKGLEFSVQNSFGSSHHAEPEETLEFRVDQHLALKDSCPKPWQNED